MIEKNKNFSVLIDRNNATKFVPIDLSVNNLDLVNASLSTPEGCDSFIKTYLQSNNADVAYGGYLEVRDLYDRSSYFQSSSKNKKRNIHLGIDFWCKAATSVCTILDGKVHSFKNNTNFGDYGPTIILEHVKDREVFYSLYGHLSIESILNLEIGQTIKKGERIASLGTPDVNGNYAPHLHFQIIKDLQGNVGDYPGVCSKEDLEYYKMNCPNPLLFLTKNA